MTRVTQLIGRFDDESFGLVRVELVGVLMIPYAVVSDDVGDRAAVDRKLR